MTDEETGTESVGALSEATQLGSGSTRLSLWQLAPASTLWTTAPHGCLGDEAVVMVTQHPHTTVLECNHFNYHPQANTWCISQAVLKNHKERREGSRQITQTNKRGSALLSEGAQMKIYPPVSGIGQPALLHFTCLK